MDAWGFEAKLLATHDLRPSSRQRRCDPIPPLAQSPQDIPCGK
jgi:hypothetical protein